MVPKQIVIVGAGGFGAEVLQYLRDRRAPGIEGTVKGFLDDTVTQTGFDVPVLGRTSNYVSHVDDAFVIAIGVPAVRQNLFEKLKERPFATIVHPTAYVAASARIAEGAIICPFAFVGAHAQIDANVVVNTYASVGHHARIGPHSVLSPYACVNGGAILHEGVFMGSHGLVLPKVSIAAGSQVAAGAVVYHRVLTKSLIVGNPGRARPVIEGRIGE